MSHAPDQVRVLFVLSDYGVGGAEKQLANIIGRRPEAAQNVDIHTITLLPPSSPHVKELFDAGGATNTLVDRSSLRFPVFFWRLVRTIRRLRPVVVCTVLNSSVGAWGRLAALIAGVPILAHSDRQLEDEGTRAHLYLRPHLDRRTDLFLPNAHAIADKLLATGIPQEKIAVVPNGVNTNVFNPSSIRGMRTELGIGPDQVVLGFLGRFAAVKRLDLLVAALERLPEEVRPDKVLLAGDGPCMESVRRQVAGSSWLPERTLLLGSIDRTPEFLATIDYLVLSSDSEGLPNVVLEAMAMSKPVVSTDVSDLQRLLDGAGFLAEVGDAASLAQAIERMQEIGTSGRRELGARARQKVVSQYSMDVSSDRFWRYLLEPLKHVRPSSATSEASNR